MTDAVAAIQSTPPSPEELATRARIKKTAKDFEQSFLQVMLGQMFDTVEQGAFSGGAGEGAFKSFLTDSFAKSIADRGGVGLSKDLTRAMLKMQGLS